MNANLSSTSTRSASQYVTRSNLEGAQLITSKKALSERGIDKMLKEVREDNKENDAEHMKPVGLICVTCRTKY